MIKSQHNVKRQYKEDYFWKLSISVFYLSVDMHSNCQEGFVVKADGGNEFPCISLRNSDIIYCSGDFLIKLDTATVGKEINNT